MNINKMDVHSIRNLFDQGGQGHVFNYWEELSATQRQKLLTELSSIDVKKCNQIFRKATTVSAANSVELEVLPEAVFDSLIDVLVLLLFVVVISVGIKGSVFFSTVSRVSSIGSSLASRFLR